MSETDATIVHNVYGPWENGQRSGIMRFVLNFTLSWCMVEKSKFLGAECLFEILTSLFLISFYPLHCNGNKKELGQRKYLFHYISLFTVSEFTICVFNA